MEMVIRLNHEAVRVTAEAVELLVPDRATAMRYVREHCNMFARWAVENDRPYALVRAKCGKSFKIPSSLAASGETDSNEPLTIKTSPIISSYAPARLSVDASYEAIQDFIAGQRAAGKIVTIMSMCDRDPAKNDLFLAVNDLQIQHRAGGWRMNDWIGTNAKSTVWVRSFDSTLPKAGSRPPGHNYYSELIRRIKSGEHFIQGFEYLIDRPNNAGLWLDVTDYHFASDFGGTAIRIAVSDPTNSTQVESYEVEP